jgi:hypothetical protein
MGYSKYDRGKLALLQLSSVDQAVLAKPWSKATQLTSEQIKRFKRLCIVEDRNGHVELTSLGLVAALIAARIAEERELELKRTTVRRHSPSYGT